jgi:GDP-L-fucose synthase
MILFDENIGTPDSIHGWPKLTSEYLERIAWEMHSIKSVVYRPFSGYGNDENLAYSFPNICKSVVKSQNSPIFIVGVIESYHVTSTITRTTELEFLRLWVE